MHISHLFVLINALFYITLFYIPNPTLSQSWVFFKDFEFSQILLHKQNKLRKLKNLLKLVALNF